MKAGLYFFSKDLFIYFYSPLLSKLSLGGQASRGCALGAVAGFRLWRRLFSPPRGNEVPAPQPPSLPSRAGPRGGKRRHRSQKRARAAAFSRQCCPLCWKTSAPSLSRGWSVSQPSLPHQSCVSPHRNPDEAFHPHPTSQPVTRPRSFSAASRSSVLERSFTCPRPL